jgi:hypothetical protein
LQDQLEDEISEKHSINKARRHLEVEAEELLDQIEDLEERLKEAEAANLRELAELKITTSNYFENEIAMMKSDNFVFLLIDVYLITLQSSFMKRWSREWRQSVCAIDSKQKTTPST